MSQLDLRDEAEESMTEGDLPEQGGGARVPTIMPGIHHMQIPTNVDQLWEAKDLEKKDADGNVLMKDGKPVTEQHLYLKFDRDNPLIVQGDEYDGLPFSATITTIARRRGKRNDPNAPLVSDMTYLLRDSLADQTPIKLRKDYIPAINAHAGHVIRVETGLQAQCDPERVRYVSDGAGGTVEDPEGTKGCGAAGGQQNGRTRERLYTSDFQVQLFQVQTTGEAYNTREEALEAAAAIGVAATDVKAIKVYTDRVLCRTCGASLRGFPRIERFLKPLASVQKG